jgi:hypothetical protein
MRIIFVIFIIIIFFVFMWLIITQPLSSVLSILPEVLLVLVTMLYVYETQKISNKTAESVEATKELIRTTSRPHEIKRKSMAKKLLFEVQENNYYLDSLKHELEITDLPNRKLNQIKDFLDFYNIIRVKFDETIYKVSLENGFDIDFNNNKLLYLVRSYYQKLTELNDFIKIYNNIKIDNQSFSAKKHFFSIIIDIVKDIKRNKIDENLIENLQIEADFDLEKQGLIKKFKNEDADFLNEIVKVIADVKRAKNN